MNDAGLTLETSTAPFPHNISSPWSTFCDNPVFYLLKNHICELQARLLAAQLFIFLRQEKSRNARLPICNWTTRLQPWCFVTVDFIALRFVRVLSHAKKSLIRNLNSCENCILRKFIQNFGWKSVAITICRYASFIFYLSNRFPR